jgi:hypothetical protein
MGIEAEWRREQPIPAARPIGYTPFPVLVSRIPPLPFGYSRWGDPNLRWYQFRGPSHLYLIVRPPFASSSEQAGQFLLPDSPPVIAREQDVSQATQLPNRSEVFTDYRRLLKRNTPYTTSLRQTAQVSTQATTLAKLVEQQTSILEEVREIRSFQQSTQQRDEAYFKKLLDRQYTLENALGVIYRRGQQQQETLTNILSAINDQRVELAKVASTVNSLRLWAKLMQQTGLPDDYSLRVAMRCLEQTQKHLGGVQHYMEINLPLVPGILNYKIEIVAEHKDELAHLYLYLLSLWKRVKRW